MSSKPEPMMWLRDTGQWIPCFDRCQLTITQMSNIKVVCCKPKLLCLSPLAGELAAMVRDRCRRRVQAPPIHGANDIDPPLSFQAMYLVARIIFMVLGYSLTPTVITMVNTRWVKKISYAQKPLTVISQKIFYFIPFHFFFFWFDFPMASLSHCFLLTYLLQHEHPYISAMIGNGSVHYDHDRDGTLSQVAGCSVSIYLC